MQKKLLATGAHGGNMKTFKDAALSGKSNNIPKKASFSGCYFAKLFQPSSLLRGSPKVYMDVVDAEKSRL